MLQLAVVGFVDKMEAKRRRTQRSKEQMMMRSESEQQWLSRLSGHRTGQGIFASDSRMGQLVVCLSFINCCCGNIAMFPHK